MGKSGKLQIRVPRLRLLEGCNPGKQPPVHLRQNHMHCQVGGGQAPLSLLPGRPCRGRKGNLKHRNPGRVQRRRPLRPASRKGRRVDDRHRRQMGHLPRHPLRRARRLQRGRKKPHHREPAGAQRRHHRLHGGQICGHQIRPVEHYQHQRRLLRARNILGGAPRRGVGGRRPPSDSGLRKSRQNRAANARLRQPSSDHRQGLGSLDRSGIQPRGQRHLRQRGLRGDGTASVAQMLQPPQGRQWQGRDLVQPRIRPPVCRKNRQRDPARPGKHLDLLQPVGPVGNSADQPDQDAPGTRQRLFDIGIDGQRMFQRGDIGQPQRRHPPISSPATVPSRRKGPEVGV